MQHDVHVLAGVHPDTLSYVGGRPLDKELRQLSGLRLTIR